MDENRKKPSGPDRSSRTDSPRDLGTSSDRAMFDDESPGRSGSMDTSERGSGSADARGKGSSGERNSSDSGGITNRERSREECEQEQLPERGRSRSE